MATLQDYGISKVVDLSQQEAIIKITEHHPRAGGRRHSVSCWARFLRPPPWACPLVSVEGNPLRLRCF